MNRAKRVVVLGLDAMIYNTMDRFLEEGVLPNFAKLIERGGFTRLLPVIPAQTPTNWTTIATGATPGTHGVVQWGSHIPGEPVREFHREEAFNEGLCRAEYIWETARQAGMKSVVMNYAGYPPRSGSVTHIDWLFQPARSYFDLAESTVYHNCPELNTTDPVELSPTEGWENVPESSLPPLQTKLIVAAVAGDIYPVLHALVTASDDGYDTVTICRGRNTADAVATLRVAEWSEWITGEFSTEVGDTAEGAFRFQLIELAGDGSRVRLFRSDAFPTDARFCSNPKVARRLADELGPYVHSGTLIHKQTSGQANWDTIDQWMTWEAAWWSDAAAIACDVTDASLVYLHWHNLDSMGHSLVAKIDPTGTDYDPATADEAWETVRNYYRAADRFVGAFLEKFDDGDTAFIIVSDHGMPANRRAVSLVNLFKNRGWLTLTDDGKDVDWAVSKVFFAQNHLWINLEGRDEGGIVPQSEYDPLRNEIIAAMRDIKDPDTGEHSLAFVLAREDAPVVGLWGDYLGDIAYCYSGGYRWSGSEVLKMGEERIVFPCGGGNHGPMIQTFETETTSVMAAMVIAGAGVKATERFPDLDQARFSTTDVAPTAAFLLGIDPPAQSEGRILREFLNEFETKMPKRKLEETRRKITFRPSAKPKTIVLQGDVTDEDQP